METLPTHESAKSSKAIEGTIELYDDEIKKSLVNVRQLYSAGGVTAQDIYNIAWSQIPYGSKNHRVDLVSFIIKWSQSGESEEHIAIHAAAIEVLRFMISEKRSF